MNFYQFKDFMSLWILAICMFLAGSWVGSKRPDLMYIDLLAFLLPLAGWFWWSRRHKKYHAEKDKEPKELL